MKIPSDCIVRWCTKSTHLLVLALVICGCQTAPSQQEAPNEDWVVYEVPNLETLGKSFTTWWSYHATHVHFEMPFQGFDTAQRELDASAFLNQVSTGNYLVVKTAEVNSVPQLQLRPTGTSDASITETIRLEAKAALQKMAFIQKPFPKFSVRSLSGKTFSNASELGKYLVVKTWFIHCVRCVQEMPELNEMVTKYGHRKDVHFLSLAIDDAEPLRSFLSKTTFLYETVPNQEPFMTDSLKVWSYPTHFIVGPDGNIIRVLTNGNDVVRMMERLLMR